ncbi:MAG: hypothetical protein ABIK56_02335 [candidate division WOR-3 bacterium]
MLFKRKFFKEKNYFLPLRYLWYILIILAIFLFYLIVKIFRYF